MNVNEYILASKFQSSFRDINEFGKSYDIPVNEFIGLITQWAHLDDGQREFIDNMLDPEQHTNLSTEQRNNAILQTLEPEYSYKFVYEITYRVHDGEVVTKLIVSNTMRQAVTSQPPHLFITDVKQLGMVEKDSSI